MIFVLMLFFCSAECGKLHPEVLLSELNSAPDSHRRSSQFIELSYIDECSFWRNSNQTHGPTLDGYYVLVIKGFDAIERSPRTEVFINLTTYTFRKMQPMFVIGDGRGLRKHLLDMDFASEAVTVDERKNQSQLYLPLRDDYPCVVVLIYDDNATAVNQFLGSDFLLSNASVRYLKEVTVDTMPYARYSPFIGCQFFLEISHNRYTSDYPVHREFDILNLKEFKEYKSFATDTLWKNGYIDLTIQRCNIKGTYPTAHNTKVQRLGRPTPGWQNTCIDFFMDTLAFRAYPTTSFSPWNPLLLSPCEVMCENPTPQTTLLRGICYSNYTQKKTFARRNTMFADALLTARYYGDRKWGIGDEEEYNLLSRNCTSLSEALINLAKLYNGPTYKFLEAAILNFNYKPISSISVSDINSYINSSTEARNSRSDSKQPRCLTEGAVGATLGFGAGIFTGIVGAGEAGASQLGAALGGSGASAVSEAAAAAEAATQTEPIEEAIEEAVEEIGTETDQIDTDETGTETDQVDTEDKGTETEPTETEDKGPDTDNKEDCDEAPENNKDDKDESECKCEEKNSTEPTVKKEEEQLQRMRDTDEDTPSGAKCFVQYPELMTHNLNPSECSPEEEGLYRMDRLDDEAPASIQAYGLQNEADAILARSNGFWMEDFEKSVLEQSLRTSFVCPKHRREYGFGFEDVLQSKQLRKYRGTTRLQCMAPDILPDGPSHDAKKPLPKGSYRVSKAMSKVLLEKKNIFVQAGTPVCDAHHEFLKKLQAEHEVTDSRFCLRPTPRKSMAEDPKPSSLSQEICPSTNLYDSPEWTVESSPDFLNPEGMCGVDDEPSDSDSDEPEDDQQQPQCPPDQDPNREAKRAFRKIASCKNIKHLHFPPSFAALSANSKRLYAGAVNQVKNTLIELVAPDAVDELKSLVNRHLGTGIWNGDATKKMGVLLQRIAESFANARSPAEKRQVLSIAAGTFKYEVIVDYIPGLTKYYYSRASFHAKLYGTGAQEPAVASIRIKYDKKKVDAFIDYITSAHVVIDMPYGESRAKYSDGTTATIPNMCRVYINKRVIDQYKEFLRQKGDLDLFFMSESSYWKILRFCPAKSRISLHGLDSQTFAGSEGFDILAKWVQRAGELGIAQAVVKQTLSILNESRDYLKGDYKLHLKHSSPIGDHCLAFALSDAPTSPAGSLFTTECRHEHNDFCDRCEQLKRILLTIENMIRNMVVFDDDAEEIDALTEVPRAVTAIHDWRKHNARAVQAEKMKMKHTNSLNGKKVFCTCDWAMKFLVSRGRETQTMFFGKKGLSYHICVCIWLAAWSINDFLTRSYVHVFTKAFQDSAEVSAIIIHMLGKIKEEVAEVEEVVIRADNAGCYHSAALMATMAEASQRVTGIRITAWSFSEPQSGKGPADRMAASIKRNIQIFLNQRLQSRDGETNKVTNAEEFIVAASSHKGVKAVSFYTGTFEEIASGEERNSKQRGSSKRQKLDDSAPEAGTAKIDGVSQFYHFEFQNNEMKVWKFWGIGEGMVIPPRFWRGRGFQTRFVEDETKSVYENIPMFVIIREENSNGEDRRPSNRALWMWKPIRNRNEEQECDEGVVDPIDDAAVQEFSDAPEQGDGVPPVQEQRETTCPGRRQSTIDKPLFDCPEPGCIRKFRYYQAMINHVETGKHQYIPEKQTMRDYAVRQFIDKTAVQHVRSDLPELDDVMSEMEDTQNVVTGRLQKGWAQKGPRQSVRFTENVKDWLESKFNQGATSGKKFDGHILEKAMRREMNADSTGRRFIADEYLTWQQITSFFSRYAAKQRKEPVRGRRDGEWHTDVHEDEYYKDPTFPTTEELVAEEIEKNHDEIFDDS